MLLHFCSFDSCNAKEIVQNATLDNFFKIIIRNVKIFSVHYEIMAGLQGLGN